MGSDKWARAPKLALYAGEGNGQGRTYRDPTDGDSLWPSVTTVLKFEDKSSLVQWAATKVAEKARDRPDIVMGDPDLVVPRLQFAHNDFRDERAEVGTGVHNWVETDIKETWDYPELDAEQEAMVERWHEFVEDYQVRVIYSEFTVRGENFMGTADILIECTDPLTGETFICIVDIKTSKNLWYTNDMQLAALANGLYILQEVPEGTEGAFKRKGKTKKLDSWWVRNYDMPKPDKLMKLHIRAEFYDFVEVEDADLAYEEFQHYVGIHAVREKKKARMKNERDAAKLAAAA